MEIIINKIEPKKDLTAYFNTDNLCFIDIETLGFNRINHKIYLVGLVYYSKKHNSWIIEQLFIDYLNEESKLLKTLEERLNSFDLIVNYNGDSFDIPFIRDRMEFNRLDTNIMNIESFDLYKIVRKYGKYLDLENHKLKTIERYLGIYREDNFSGGECIDIYLEYINTKDSKLKEFVLMHNYEDLYYLIDLLEIIDHIDNKISFNVNDIVFKIDKIKINNNSITINLNSSEKVNLAFYEDSYTIKSIDDYNIKVELSVLKGYVEKDIIGRYFDISILDNKIIDTTQYNLPKNVLLLEIDKKEVIENVILLLEELFNLSL